MCTLLTGGRSQRGPARDVNSRFIRRPSYTRGVRPFSSLLRAVACVALVGAVTALADAEVTRSSPAPERPAKDEVWQLRARYGLAIRSGAEEDAGPGLSYAGFSPNDLALSGWLWLLFGDHLGLTVGAQREAFSLVDGRNVVTSAGLLRAHVGPTGRVRLGPARLEAAASYFFHQLPVFGTIDAPSFSPVQRHGVLLAARALVDLGPVTIEGRFEYPLALAHVGRPVRSQGLGVGGGLRVQLFRTGNVRWGVLADAQWHQDSMESTDGALALTMNQSVVRAGLALDLQWKEPTADERPRPASLLVRVVSADGAVPNATVSLTAEGQPPRDVTTDAAGEARVAELPAGAWRASARASGFLSAEGAVTLEAGKAGALDVTLPKEPPKVGGLSITVVAFETKAPVAAALDVNGRAVTASEAGVASLDGLPPGPVMVKATAPGFKPGEEAASVVAGRTTELTVTLVPEKKVLPATLSGLVRSARGGKPVAASLEIKEAKRTVNADEAGAFSTQLPGGKYSIRIAAPGFRPQTKTVIVRDGDQAIFNVDLTPQ